MSEFVLVLTTLPAEADAGALSRELVESRLAACVNIVAPVRSVYRWEGKVQADDEQQLVIKTARRHVDALWSALRARHPYDTPEFLVLAIDGGSDGYLDWLRGCTT